MRQLSTIYEAYEPGTHCSSAAHLSLLLAGHVSTRATKLVSRLDGTDRGLRLSSVLEPL